MLLFKTDNYIICWRRLKHSFTDAGNKMFGFQDEDSEALFAADFEIGHFIRERIVPRAVLYFTGEAIEDDDDDVRADG